MSTATATSSGATWPSDWPPMTPAIATPESASRARLRGRPASPTRAASRMRPRRPTVRAKSRTSKYIPRGPLPWVLWCSGGATAAYQPRGAYCNQVSIIACCGRPRMIARVAHLAARWQGNSPRRQLQALATGREPGRGATDEASGGLQPTATQIADGTRCDQAARPNLPVAGLQRLGERLGAGMEVAQGRIGLGPDLKLPAVDLLQDVADHVGQHPRFLLAHPERSGHLTLGRQALEEELADDPLHGDHRTGRLDDHRAVVGVVDQARRATLHRTPPPRGIPGSAGSPQAPLSAGWSSRNSASSIRISPVRVRWTGHFREISNRLAICSSLSGPRTAIRFLKRSRKASFSSQSSQSRAWTRSWSSSTRTLSKGSPFRRAYIINVIAVQVPTAPSRSSYGFRPWFVPPTSTGSSTSRCLPRAVTSWRNPPRLSTVICMLPPGGPRHPPPE